MRNSAAGRVVLAAAAAALLAAGSSAAGAPREAWGRILARIQAEGKYTPAEEMIPASFHLEDMQGSLDQDHVVYYVGARGFLGADGAFQPMSAFFASEDWKIGSDGNWRMDRWELTPDLDGSLTDDASHGTRIYTMNGSAVLDNTTEKISKDDARVRRKFDALIAHWSALQP
jgi:hypothetical protein